MLEIFMVILNICVNMIGVGNFCGYFDYLFKILMMLEIFMVILWLGDYYGL